MRGCASGTVCQQVDRDPPERARARSAGGVDAGRVSAVGKGETQAVSTAEDCHGTKPNAKLIACLQPDRRVDVEVSGTKAQ